MIDFRRDPETNDFIIQDGLFQKVSSINDNIVQRITTRLNRYVGEWFLDTSKGIDYFGIVFIHSPDLIVIEALFKNEILQEEGIVEIVSFELDFDRALRKLSVTFSARFKDQTVVSDIKIEVNR